MFELLNHHIQITQKQFTGNFFQKLVSSDGIVSDSFGYATSASNDGEVIAISAHNTDVKGADSGSVYIYTRQIGDAPYLQTQKLVASDGAANDRFGISLKLTLDASVLFVGAYCDDDKGGDSGSVYVFKRQPNGTYIQTQKLTASDGAAGDLFGYSISTSADGSAVIIGAYGDDDKGTDSGSLYVFKRQETGNYGQAQKLTSSVGASSARLGNSVAVSADGGVIVAGANGAAGASGAVDVFVRDDGGIYSWSQQLRAIGQPANAAFGISVSLSNSADVLVVGSHLDDAKATDSGSAYVFTRQVDGLYTQTQKLSAPDGDQTDYFGLSTAIFPGGGTILVAAHYDDDKASNSGSVYQFDRQIGGSYEFIRKLASPIPIPSAHFGRSVTVSPGNPVVVIGSVGDTGKVASTGAAYIFK